MARKRYLTVAAVVLAMMIFVSGCGAQEETIPPNETVYQYSVSATTAEDLAVLKDYPNLTEVDLRGSNCYSDIAAYIAAHPQIDVSYDVEIGETRYDKSTTELVLSDGSFDPVQLAENIPYLPELHTIQLPKTTLTADQLTAIAQAAPNARLSFSVVLFENEIDSDTTELDLSAMLPEQLDQACAVLPTLPKLSTVQLTDSSGNNKLSPVDVKKLMDNVPGVLFVYQYELFGKQVSTQDESLEYVLTRIGNDGSEQLRQALDIMPNCTYLKVDRCGVSTETMAAIREDYPDVKVAWRIFFGKFNCLTDEEMLRLTNGLTDDIVGDLKYCNDVKYLDIGHDDELTDISFIKYMPKLEIAILSGSIVSDLTPFQDHQNIEFLELCFCSMIKDISPLANCPNLKFLNISFTSVKDISATENLPMERFVAMGLKLDAASQARFLELHPQSLYRFDGQQCYGYAWRYDDYGYTFSDYYANMRVIFDYEDVGYYSGQGIYDGGY